jgi:hypothetical protein
MSIFRNYSSRFRSSTEKNQYENEAPYPPPVLLPVVWHHGDVGLRWMGSTGARTYLIEKSVAGTESFQTLAVVEDSVPSAAIIFTDRRTKASRKSKVYYRVYAMNENGKSPSSNILSV